MSYEDNIKKLKEQWEKIKEEAKRKEENKK